MQRVVLTDLPLRPARFAGWSRTVHWVLLALFLGQLALVEVRLWRPAVLFGDARWPDGLLMVLAGATTLASLTRQLPGQNVMLVAILVAFLAGAIQSLGVLTGVPFGPLTYTDRIGQVLFHPLPWAVPLLWLVALLNSRGTARLILRPWRQTWNYGWWLIGLTVLLVVLFDLALEPFATQVKQLWSWKPTKIPSDWYSTPWINFLGWGVTALLILAFITPALLRKKPVRYPPDYHPLAVWVVLSLLFLTGAAAHRLWAAVTLVGAQTLTVAVLAVRGGRGGE